jgi:pyruvate-formate lyase
MDTENHLNLLKTYRREREAGNTNTLGEATGRIYLPVPEELKAAGKNALGVRGFVTLFRQLLACSPVIVRRGEWIVGNYYFSLPYELTLQNPPVNYEALGARGALPGVPSGHTTMDMVRGLALGWKGILELIAHSRAGFADGSPEAEYLDGQSEVVSIIQEHVRAYGRAAASLAAATLEQEEVQEYQSTAERCLRLASEPPASLHDALQWFFLYLTFARPTSNGLGGVRLDQVFYPFYQRERQAGTLDNDQARLLFECLFMKEVPFSCVGGLTPQGTDAENELTWVVLDAYDAIGGTANLYLRWHAGINPRLVEHAAGILAHQRAGTPSFVNDDVIIPSLVHFGYPLEDARAYNFSGCFWWAVPGKEYSSHDLPAIDGARALMRALDDAHQAGWTDFEDLWQAYAGYLEDAVTALMEAYAAIDPWLAERYPEMVLSLLMDGCLEQGRDVNNNGVPFSLTTVMYVGLATVADSLTAIRKRVFEEKLVTLNEVLEALDHDFEGYTWVRSLLQSAPKYGNDLPEADEMAVRVANQFKDALKGRRNTKGFGLRPAFYSYHRHTWEGQTIGATPDGRRAGMPLSQGGNPAHGAARQGATAAITSMTRIRYDDTAGCPVHIHLHTGDSKTAIQTIVSLVNGSMELGAAHLILNLVDSITLRDAIVHPEKYTDLTVRVTGYSARFVQLELRLQEEIANRNEF